MEVYFAPTDSIVDSLNSLITMASKSLFFCMFKFALPPIEETLHTIFNEGRQISGVFDSSNSVAHGCAYPRMKGHPVAGAWSPPADVFIDTIYGLLHHKYFIIDADTPGDHKVAVTGSFNWEIPACTGNDENLLVIYDERINNLYFQEFLARYRESGGSLIGIGIDPHGEELQPGFSLDQNYPNPFSRETTIKFTVAAPCDVKLVIYDLMGRMVQTMVREKLKPGTYKVSFNRISCKDGIFFYRLTAGDYSETRKMMVERDK